MAKISYTDDMAQINIYPVNQWYSIEEKQPKNGQWCLICFSKGSGKYRHYEYVAQRYRGLSSNYPYPVWYDTKFLCYSYNPEKFRWQPITKPDISVY